MVFAVCIFYNIIVNKKHFLRYKFIVFYTFNIHVDIQIIHAYLFVKSRFILERHKMYFGMKKIHTISGISNEAKTVFKESSFLFFWVKLFIDFFYIY